MSLEVSRLFLIWMLISYPQREREGDAATRRLDALPRAGDCKPQGQRVDRTTTRVAFGATTATAAAVRR